MSSKFSKTHLNSNSHSYSDFGNAKLKQTPPGASLERLQPQLGLGESARKEEEASGFAYDLHTIHLEEAGQLSLDSERPDPSFRDELTTTATTNNRKDGDTQSQTQRLARKILEAHPSKRNTELLERIERAQLDYQLAFLKTLPGNRTSAGARLDPQPSGGRRRRDLNDESKRPKRASASTQSVSIEAAKSHHHLLHPSLVADLHKANLADHATNANEIVEPQFEPSAAVVNSSGCATLGPSLKLSPRRWLNLAPFGPARPSGLQLA